MRCLYCMEKYDEDLDVICPFCGNDVVNVENDSNCLPAGTVLKKRYILGRVLGDGGFGITYIGYDKALKRKVAVKEFFPNECVTRQKGEKTVTPLSGERADRYENGLKSFQEEAQRLANLGSVEGVVNVFDVFADNGTAYIVMEYLSGETVSQIVEENRRLGFGKTMNIIVPVLRSLIKIHKAGIIHRDVSPQNIIRTEEGKIVLIDFGAARQNSLSMSKSVSIVLKQGYAPIEQYDNKLKQGTWTDVYAAAATMYYMLTGVTPEYANSRLLDDTLAPISEMREGLPAELDFILRDALAVRPEDRIQTAQELLDRIMTLKDFGRDAARKKHKRPDKEVTQDVPKQQWKSYVGGTPYDVAPPKQSRTDYEPKVITIDRSLQMPVKIQTEELQPEPKKKRSAAPAIVLLLTVLILGILVTAGYLYRRDNTDIPNLVGQNISDVLGNAEYDFDFEVVYSYDPTDPLDVVINQYPEPTTRHVKRDSSITLTVNSEDAEIMVPVVSKLDESVAIATLKKWTFEAEIIRELNDNVPEGTVIRTDPASGTKVKGKSKVKVYIAENTSEVPKLLGMTVSEAGAALEKVGLKLGETTSDYSEVYEIGTVMKQSIDSGNKVEKGTEVSLVISKGAPYYVAIDAEVDLSSFQDYAPITVDVIEDGTAKFSSSFSKEDLTRSGYKYKFELNELNINTAVEVEIKIDDQLYQTYVFNFETEKYEITETYEIALEKKQTEPSTSTDKAKSSDTDKKYSSNTSSRSEDVSSEPKDEPKEPVTEEVSSDIDTGEI